jgi:hypothetical protein
VELEEYMVDHQDRVELLQELKEMVVDLADLAELHKTTMVAAAEVVLLVILVMVVVQELVILELDFQDQVAAAVAAAVSLLVEHKTMVVVE